MGIRSPHARHCRVPVPDPGHRFGQRQRVSPPQSGGRYPDNEHLYQYCLDHKITFTRSRAHHSNDGAHVEQKNWTHVRELVGYLRYDTPAELAVLNEIWELDRGFTNYLLPQQKLVFKQLGGAKVTKRYDSADPTPKRYHPQ